jgi:GR25 family glycosyltransferase involved in LPS biosynthesis
MRIAGFDVQPILLHIQGDEKYEERFTRSKQHLEDNGIIDTIFVSGINAKEQGVVGTLPYELDNPNGGHMIGQKYVGSFLSQYMVYNIMNSLPNEYYLFMECDISLPENFLRKLEFEMFNLPNDFDFLFIESCCAMDKPKTHIGGNVHRIKKSRGYPCMYPLGGACYIVSKKSIPHIINTQRVAYAPADLSLGMHSFYAMDVYAILPRLVNQLGNENLPA